MWRSLKLCVISASALALVGCDDNRGASKAPVASCAQWTVQHSRNMPACIDGSFDFPVGRDGVHYIVRPVREPLLGKTVAMSFEIEGAAEFVALQNEEPKTGRVRLYIQNSLDDGTRPFGRWWSRDVVLARGAHTLSAVLVAERDEWSSVYGQRSKDEAATFALDVSRAGSIGFTFGGMFAGHGVYATAPARFVLRSFEVNGK